MIDEDKSLEARLVAERLVALLKQRQIGNEQIQPPQEAPKTGGKELLSMLKGGATPATGGVTQTAPIGQPGQEAK